MKIKLECLNCLFKQVLEASRMITEDRNKIKKVIDKYAKIIPDINLNYSSPKIAQGIHLMVKKELNVDDPYQEFKTKHIKLAQKIYPEVKKHINNSADPIKTALIMSASGNSIDSGIELEINVDKAVTEGIEWGFSIDNYMKFKKRMYKANDLLIIGDNSGEAVFDKLLIEEIKNRYNLKIMYAVRSEPVLNDITLKEARDIKLTEVCKVVDSGSSAPGLLLNTAEPKFKKIFYNSDLILSKGQGNFESLSEIYQKNIFYLLKAKCNVIAEAFEVKAGSLILKHSDD